MIQKKRITKIKKRKKELENFNKIENNKRENFNKIKNNKRENFNKIKNNKRREFQQNYFFFLKKRK